MGKRRRIQTKTGGIVGRAHNISVMFRDPLGAGRAIHGPINNRANAWGVRRKRQQGQMIDFGDVGQTNLLALLRANAQRRVRTGSRRARSGMNPRFRTLRDKFRHDIRVPQPAALMGDVDTRLHHKERRAGRHQGGQPGLDAEHRGDGKRENNDHLDRQKGEVAFHDQRCVLIDDQDKKCRDKSRSGDQADQRNRWRMRTIMRQKYYGARDTNRPSVISNGKH